MKNILLAILCAAAINTFAGNEQLESVLIQNWVSGNWQNHKMEEYSYGSNGQLITDAMRNWDAPDQVWQNTFTYNHDGSVSTETFQSLNSITGGWDDESRYTYTYTADGKVETSLYQVWVDGGWQNERLITNAYDENGNLVSYTSENGNNHDWPKHITQLYYDHNPDGSVSGQTIWNNLNGEGTNKLSSIYSYTYSAGHLSTTLNQDYYADERHNWAFDHYAYDDAGTLIADTTQSWDAGAQAWVNKTLTTYSANTMLTRVWDAAEGWVNASLTTYTYSASGISGEPSIVEGIYPNPATDIVNIDMVNPAIAYDVSITDVTGKEVWTKTATTGKEQIDIASFADGIYMLTVRQTGQSSTQKIVKQ